MAQTQQINSRSLSSIMKGRTSIPASAEGRKAVVTIQGNGNVIEVKNKAGENVASYDGTGTPFEKKVFNCKANSQIAMNNPRNKAILMAGLKAEKSAEGKVSFVLNEKEGAKDYTAHELFNAYLNKVQFSFNVPLPSPIADMIGDRDEISAKVQLIKTENGEILTLDPKSIKVLEPEVYGNTEFKLPDFDTDEDEIDADDALNGDEFTAMDRKGLVAKAKELGIKTKDRSDDEVRTDIRAKVAILAEEEA